MNDRIDIQRPPSPVVAYATTNDNILSQDIEQLSHYFEHSCHIPSRVAQQYTRTIFEKYPFLATREAMLSSRRELKAALLDVGMSRGHILMVAVNLFEGETQEMCAYFKSCGIHSREAMEYAADLYMEGLVVSERQVMELEDNGELKVLLGRICMVEMDVKALYGKIYETKKREWE